MLSSVTFTIRFGDSPHFIDSHRHNKLRLISSLGDSYRHLRRLLGTPLVSATIHSRQIIGTISITEVTPLRARPAFFGCRDRNNTGMTPTACIWTRQHRDHSIWSPRAQTYTQTKDSQGWLDHCYLEWFRRVTYWEVRKMSVGFRRVIVHVPCNLILYQTSFSSWFKAREVDCFVQFAFL